jgi:hypothetical protein
MFIGGDGGKINTVCWMLVEAQIRGRGRVALTQGKWLLHWNLFSLGFCGKEKVPHLAHQRSRDFFGHTKNIQLWAGIETSKVDLRWWWWALGKV